MKRIEKDLSLKDGKTTASLDIYDDDDKTELLELYRSWKNASELSLKLGGRKINLPEALSEGAFCHFKKVGRLFSCTGNVNRSFDCVDYNNEKDGYNMRIQVKASGVENDLTSFGPSSKWDKIYFCDFSRLDGTFDVYLIPNELIYNYEVNSKQTMQDQQRQGKRPRMSLKSLIKDNNISRLDKFNFEVDKK